MTIAPVTINPMELKDLTIDQLKVLAYDESASLVRIDNNLKLLNQEINKRQNEQKGVNSTDKHSEESNQPAPSSPELPQSGPIEGQPEETQDSTKAV